MSQNRNESWWIIYRIPYWNKATLIPKKNGNKCFKYSVIVALNHEESIQNLEIIWKTKPFVDKYNWKGINYPPKNNGCKRFE